MPSFPELAVRGALCAMGGESYPGGVRRERSLLGLGARAGRSLAHGVSLWLPLPLLRSGTASTGEDLLFAPTWSATTDQFATYVSRLGLYEDVSMAKLWARLRVRRGVDGGWPYIEVPRRRLAALLGPTTYLGAHLAVRGALDLAGRTP